MKQLIDIAATVSSLTCRAEKSGREWSDERAATLTVVANCDGKAAAQFFPSKKAWEALADALFDDEGAIKLRLGTFALDYEIQGGVVDLKCPLWDKPLSFDLADVKSLSITPNEGRMCEIRFAINVHPADDEWEELVRMLKREIIVCARKAPGGKERAELAGQTSMPLQQANGEKPDDDETGDETGDSGDTTGDPVNGTDESGSDPLVPGQKAPQRAKRSSAAALN